MLPGGGGVGENDIQSIREDLGEVKQSLSGINKAVTDLRVLVAGNYVTKEDFQKCQDCAENRIVELHRKVDGQFAKILGAATFVGMVIQLVANFFKH